MFTNKKKIALVGTGMVGMSFAYAALNQNLCDELVFKPRHCFFACQHKNLRRKLQQL